MVEGQGKAVSHLNCALALEVFDRPHLHHPRHTRVTTRVARDGSRSVCVESSWEPGNDPGEVGEVSAKMARDDGELESRNMRKGVSSSAGARRSEEDGRGATPVSSRERSRRSTLTFRSRVAASSQTTYTCACI